MSDPPVAWQTLATEAADGFRLGCEAQGSLQLTRLIDALLPALATSLAPRMASIQPVLIELLQAQTRADWLCVADLLEYELSPLL